ncbi:MAG: hypothetical protein ASARMPREDX12_004273 [Alectoria sarmentosa]|nr:MAG: hypothetical protein ASARMPREDX12_004273 [Alectoria sarmentosa]
MANPARIDPLNAEDPNEKQERFYDGVKPGRGGRPKLKVKLARPAPPRRNRDEEGQRKVTTATQEKDAFVCPENEVEEEESSSGSESDEDIFIAQSGERTLHIKTEDRA